MVTPEFQGFVGRETEFGKLKSIFEEFAARPSRDGGLTIVGLSGYGGVGKTYLLEKVREETREQLSSALQISVDASNEEHLQDFTTLIDYRLAPLELASPANPRNDYFQSTRRLIRKQTRLTAMVNDELESKDNLDDHIKAFAQWLYRLRPMLEHIPKAGALVSVGLKGLEDIEAEKAIAPAIKALKELRSLSDDQGWFRVPLVKRQLQSLRKDPFEAFGEAYFSDLTAMLAEYQKRDRWKLTHSSIAGLDRLLFIVDDFEATGTALGDFLVKSVFQRLKNARFATLAIVVGRDDLIDANSDFSIHLGGSLKPQIRLEPFSQDDGIRLLKESGYGEKDAEGLYSKSRGYPFILRFFVENRTPSAIFYSRFYERTTRWMNDEQEKWLTRLCYLDVVNEGTIKAFLTDVDSGLVMDWFIKEASLRDTKSEKYFFDPFIRHMLLEHRKTRIGESEHRRLLELAKNVGEG